MKSQLNVAKTVCDQVFGYGYGGALQRLMSFLVANSLTDIRFLILQDLKLYLVSRYQLSHIGRQLMLDSFPPQP